MRAERVLVAGAASGEVIASDKMLSFWGGVDPDTGTVIDQRHPLVGAEVAGRIVVLPKGKGSSTGSYVLLDSWTQGNGPAGLLLNRVDEVIALGAVVHQEFNEVTVPVFVLDDESFAQALTAQCARLYPDGTVLLDEPTSAGARDE